MNDSTYGADWANFPRNKYDVVLTDPPWSYYGQQDKWGAAAKFYKTAPDEALLTMPMRRIMRDKSVLFMWATSPRLDFAMSCIQRWGLHFRGVAFVWVKTRGDGQPIGAQGVRPSIVKPTAEYVLAASPVQKGRPIKLNDESVRNVLLAPKGAHSEKPHEVHECIERMYPDMKKLELFGRRLRTGWDIWGDEVDHGPAIVPRHTNGNAKLVEASSIRPRAPEKPSYFAQPSLLDVLKAEDPSL